MSSGRPRLPRAVTIPRSDAERIGLVLEALDTHDPDDDNRVFLHRLPERIVGQLIEGPNGAVGTGGVDR